MAAVHAPLVRRIAVLSAPHPLRWQGALRDADQRHASRYIARFQVPWHPERWLVAADAANVGRLLDEWGGPSFPDPQTDRRCRDAMQILAAPHCALEYYRWAVRSVPRADGRRFRRTVRRPILAPTLQLHGALDRCVLPATAQGSSRYVSGPYEWRLLDRAGHFPHEELPDVVSGELLRWCKES
jgi:pimeloyl-ACP methyl ester carboxylesterase